MTIEQIMAEETRKHVEYEAKTVAARINGQDVTIADLRTVFDSMCDAADWKNGFSAYVPHQSVAAAVAAIAWFHGDKAVWVGGIQPITGRVKVGSDGYAG